MYRISSYNYPGAYKILLATNHIKVETFEDFAVFLSYVHK